MENKKEFLIKCKRLLEAYGSGELGQTKMPEDSNPKFSEEEQESRIAYFTLPMALNYQRDSYKLWEAATRTWQDQETREVFNVTKSPNEEKLRELLTRYKVALQPNKHINTWQTISNTVKENFGSFSNLITSADSDYLKLKEIVQTRFKKGFPYLSGPKIFNYWCFILTKYAGINLANSEFIEIAPDTHIIKCSVKLGVISEEESEKISKEEISKRWRDLLAESEINPIEMHAPLWFWSRNGFLIEV